jgi:folate-binding protein YgfZ
MTATTAPPLRLDASLLPEDEVDALLNGSVEGIVPAVVVDVEGGGAVKCLQGLLSCDIETSGERGFLYGAVLTRFGMILADCWVARGGDDVRLVVPPSGAEPLMEVLRRSLPPRLAKATQRSKVAVVRVAGPRAAATTEGAGLEPPEPGAVTTLPVAHGRLDLARATDAAPFTLQLSLPSDAVSLWRERLRGSGAREGSSNLFDLARVLAGWPALGHEIDEKTLPQEVRFDEIGGVSYTKGCYVGQETVARVHFRGHPNRHLEGLLFEREPTTHSAVLAEGNDVGRVTAQVWLGSKHRWLGLAVLRREVDPGSSLVASGVGATVVPLPFAPEII